MYYVNCIYIYKKQFAMKTEYKSSNNRLIKYFEESRNKWKKRSLTYQEEKRELLIQKRDLERSKEKWKAESIELKIQLELLKKKYQKIQDLARIILDV
jgi:hypothetical protein